ncbi:MAG: MFS transporter [Kineosporiaceae bacterium]
MSVVPGTPALRGRTGRRRPHRAWAVAGVAFLALVAAAAFRSSTGVLIEPVEVYFGWSRVSTSGAVSLNLAVYGLTAPFAAALMERFGLRRVALVALGLVAAGSAGTLAMTQPWHLAVLWGVVVGFGTGSLAPVFGAVVANRWFVDRRGLVTGVFAAASATGQLAFLPLVAVLVSTAGWRTASLVVSALALACALPVGLLLHDRPADVGALPYGVSDPDDPRIPRTAPAGRVGGAGGGRGERAPGPGRAAVAELVRCLRVPTFWLLAGTFFVCGWSTNGLVGTHFVAAAHDHGMPTTTAAGLLAVVGMFDIVGTVASGWLSDRVDPRLLLLAYYGLRGLSLLAVPAVLGPHVDPPLLFFVAFYGLDWVATVPPTVALCREHFGLARSGVVFGWVFASHMVGAAVAAAFAGAVREATGTYSPAWWTAGGLCLVAAVACLAVRREPEPARDAVG